MFLLKLQNKTIYFLLFTLVVVVHHQLFGASIPFSHDGENHLARFAAYAKAFQDGHVPPRWAGDLNYRYGTPVFNFFYPLPGYLASFVQIFFPLEFTLNLLFLTTVILSLAGMHLWIKKFVHRDIAVLSALLYAFAPYQMLNIYVRGDIGESLALSLVPFIFLFVERYRNQPRIPNALVAGIFLALLILAHHGIALMFMPLILLYIVVRLLGGGIHSGILITILFGFGISAFFWIPGLLEHRYTLAATFIGDMYRDHFNTILRIISSPWGTGANIQQSNGLAPQLGLILSLCCVFSVIFALANHFRKKKTDLLAALFFLFMLCGIFLSTSQSTFLWETLPLLHKYQFPWRFTALLTFSAIAFISLHLSRYNKLFLYGLIFAHMIFSVHFTQTAGWVRKGDNYYKSFPGTTYYHEEAATIWSTGSAGTYPKDPVEIISGTGVLSEYQRKTQQQQITVTANTPLQLKMNTLYYPGWRAYINNTEVPIQFQDPNNRGLITFTVPAGTHRVKIVFSETKFRLIANSISILSILTAVVIFARSRKQQYV